MHQHTHNIYMHTHTQLNSLHFIFLPSPFPQKILENIYSYRNLVVHFLVQLCDKISVYSVACPGSGRKCPNNSNVYIRYIPMRASIHLPRPHIPHLGRIFQQGPDFSGDYTFSLSILRPDLWELEDKGVPIESLNLLCILTAD